MPKLISPECIEEAFELYLKYNGANMPAIEKEMRQRGWTTFSSQRIRKLVNGEYIGWESEFGWKKALEIKLANHGKAVLTKGEKLYEEVETIRGKLFERIKTHGVDNRDLVWQHDKYSQRSAEILAIIEKSKDVDFAGFLKFLITISVSISPALARELCNAEDAIIRRAKNDFSK